ncbi:MAG: lytic transglycosylase domain-containing protein [Candidatus Eremiobacteraeota bacterium]|nr:lytic transglycosylase domain-containing protein [Candidatus Eremiobacteraeota bacterium]
MFVDSTARLAAAGVAYAPEIATAAQRHGVDPCLLAAVAAQETGGPDTNAGRNVVGDGGHGRGLFQIDDRWHAFARTGAAMEPATNADYAAGMLRGLLDRYGNVHEALSAYNAGSPDATGTETDWGGARLGYADSVLRHYEQIAGGGPPPESMASQPPASAMQAGPFQAFQPPQLPTIQQQSYHRQATDYSGLFDDDADA